MEVLALIEDESTSETYSDYGVSQLCMNLLTLV